MTAEERLLEIIHGEEKSKFTLPMLDEEKSQWLQSIQDKINALKDWLRGYLPESTDYSMPLGSKQVLFYTVLALLVMLIVFLIFKFARYLALRIEGIKNAPMKTLIIEKAEPLDQSLQSAISAQQWNLASRILWRIYIRTKKMSGATTPLEASAAYKMDFTKYYPLMFANNNDVNFFNQMKQTLQSSK